MTAGLMTFPFPLLIDLSNMQIIFVFQTAWRPLTSQHGGPVLNLTVTFKHDGWLNDLSFTPFDYSN
jgi:hypothetical protein